MSAAALPARRGTSNGNERGNSKDRRRRREWLVTTYRANVDVISWLDKRGPHEQWPDAPVVQRARIGWLNQMDLAYTTIPTCRCYRCGVLLTVETVTVDRIIPGCKGGTYRRDNIRPACGDCNSETGGPLSRGREHQAAKRAARRRAGGLR